MVNKQIVKQQVKQMLTISEQWRYDEVIPLCRQLLENLDPFSPDSNLKEWRLRTLQKLIDALRLTGHHQEAWNFAQQYQQEAWGNVHHTLLALDELAWLLWQSGKVIEAERHTMEALKLAKEHNHTYGLARVYQMQGRLATFSGRTEEAIMHYYKAIALYQQLQMVEELMHTWNSMGFVEHQVGRLDKAILACQEALKIARHIKHPFLGMLLNNLGENYQNLFDMTHAYQYHQEALVFIQSLPHSARPRPSVIADIYRNLGVDSFYLGHLDEAQSQLEQTLALLAEEDDLEIRLQTLSTATLINLKRDNKQQAWIEVQTLLRLATEHQAKSHMARAFYLLGLCYQADDNKNKAQELWQQSLFLAHETTQRFLIWRVHAALAKVAPLPTLAQVHFQIATETILQIIAPITDQNLRQCFLSAPEVQQIIAYQ